MSVKYFGVSWPQRYFAYTSCRWKHKRVRPFKSMPTFPAPKQLPYKDALKQYGVTGDRMQYLSPESEDKVYGYFDEMRRNYDVIGDNQWLEKQKDEIRKEMRKAAWGTIKKKYFPEPPEPNLLTWSAKAQIKHLHEIDKQYWDPKRISESFPISVRGAQKLLKSRYVPRAVTDLLEHDRRVQENWKQLKQKTGRIGGPLPQGQKLMLEDGRIHLLSAAAGVSSLPAPDHLLPPPDLDREHKPGPFERTVMKYCEERRAQQKAKEMTSQEILRAIEQLTLENRKLLGFVQGSRTVKLAVKKREEAQAEGDDAPPALKQLEDGQRSLKDSQVAHVPDEPTSAALMRQEVPAHAHAHAQSPSAPPSGMSMLDSMDFGVARRHDDVTSASSNIWLSDVTESDPRGDVTNRSSLRRRRRSRDPDPPREHAISEEDMGMAGTGRITPEKPSEPLADLPGYHDDEFQPVRRYADEPAQAEAYYRRVREDTNPRGQQETYVYNPYTGSYDYPYGRAKNRD